MPRPRKSNRDLPKRVYLRSGSYYYVDFSGKWINLGRNRADAMAEHSKMLGADWTIRTLNDLADRYMIEVSAVEKAESTHKRNLTSVKNLRKRLGHMLLADIQPRDIYAVMDLRAKEGKEVSANRELSLLSHMFKKAIRWGVAEFNPAIGLERFKEEARDRYVTEDEYQAFRQYAGPRMAAYMDFKVLTGLRQGDILRLKRSSLQDDGIHAYVSKSKQNIIIEWSDLLRQAVDALLALHPKQVKGLYLVCKRNGQPYTSDGFRTIWQRTMRSAMDRGVLAERFTEHDLRAKTGSEVELDHATRLLAHMDSRTTRKHYRRQAERVKPAK